MIESTTARGPKMPTRIAALPRDRAGRPVPWFVPWLNGAPEFRVSTPEKVEAGAKGQCWVCGTRRSGPTSAFVIGPMCAVNRISAEPPSHRECAIYSACACPFLNNPDKVRRTVALPPGVHDPAGTMELRNPGVTLVWITRSWHRFEPPDGGVLFDIGEPVRTLWFAEGRTATRAEVEASIDSGLPILRAAATTPAAELALDALVARARRLLP